MVNLFQGKTQVTKQHNMETTTLVKRAKFNDLVEEAFLKELTRPKQLKFRVENAIVFYLFIILQKADIKIMQAKF